MSDQPFMTALMCDDVRREEGKKLSYLGIYAESLLVPHFPVALPKLCFVMSVIYRTDQELPHRLSFRLYKDDELMTEVPIEESELVRLRSQITSQVDGEPQRLTIATVIQVFPLQLEGECVLKARAICDEEELKGGSWRVARSAQS